MSPLQFAQLSPHKEKFPFPEPSFRNLQGPQQRSSPPGSPNRGPIERDAPFPEPPFNHLSECQVNGHVCPLSLPPHILTDPQKGAPPQQSSRKERCSLSEALQLSLKIPSQRTPQVPQQVPEARGVLIQSFLLYFSLKAPGK